MKDQMAQTEQPQQSEYEEYIDAIEAVLGELSKDEYAIAWQCWDDVSAAIDEIRELKYSTPSPFDT